MALEGALHISELVITNPPGGDAASTIDEHLRLIKSVLKTDFGAISGAVTATHTELNKLAGYSGAIPELGTAQTWTRQQNFGTYTLTDGAVIDWDLNLAQVAKVTLGGNRSLNAPTNMKDGGTYILRIIQDPTGGRTLSFNSAFKFTSGIAPTLTTGGSAVDLLSCISDGTKMECSMTFDVR